MNADQTKYIFTYWKKSKATCEKLGYAYSLNIRNLITKNRFHAPLENRGKWGCLYSSFAVLANHITFYQDKQDT